MPVCGVLQPAWAAIIASRTGIPKTQRPGRAGNNKIARRNLLCTVAGDHVAFSIWSLWSVMALFMPASVYGFSAGDKLLLGAVATLVGGGVRIPYTLGIARFGGRNWTTFSAFVLLIPTVGTIVLLANPGPAAVAIYGVRGADRTRRGQLRGIAGQRQRVLSPATQGRGAGDQRRRRQPWCRGDPTGRSAGAGHRGPPGTVLGMRGLPCAAGHRRRRGGAVHGQPRSRLSR